MSIIFARRSVRDFLAKAVEQDKIERVLRAAMAAPSAHNRQPWEFFVVTEAADRKAIAEMGPYSKMCATAPVVIAVCVNKKLGEISTPEDTWWQQDLAAATENILLQLVEEGLGGVWLGWYPDKKRCAAFADYFTLPEHIVPLSLVALGYDAKPETPDSVEQKKAARFDPKRVHYGSF
ncbi:MAG: nitroreductase family protein [Spirochaetaceae bacterium]|jgi:nitroreductase|nr:nitroreductase family protein [Spirochaetaceae bacterium]